ncbi:MAG: STM4012 family radical SAM protein [Lentisphaerales bacterium]|nr:STM4012 family radical SAM protein [Lentisphaerales bacterium]
MSLQEMLAQGMYHSYAYSYPHKLAYRPFEAPVSLQNLWQDERRDSLFLYYHLPFCEMRCGFCNLFTVSQPEQDMVDQYLNQLELQTRQVHEILNPSFSRIAVGGGTPSFLNQQQLEKFSEILNLLLTDSPKELPFSFEVSPATLTKAKLSMLKQMGVSRISMGVQSLTDSELRNLGRPQKLQDVVEAIKMIQDENFYTLNLDLIYGIKGQSLASWQHTLREISALQPEELYLYPLYVRPLTGLGKRNEQHDDDRFKLYKFAQEFLINLGYRQISKRLFRKARNSSNVFPEYSCQEDGMIGLGAGARSYTKDIHYSSEYAVGKSNVKSIISNYIQQNSETLNSAQYGIELSEDEHKRRFIIKSLLHIDGLSFKRYQEIYGIEVKIDFPQITELDDLNLVNRTRDKITRNQEGLDASDVIGPWLYSADIKTKIGETVLT